MIKGIIKTIIFTGIFSIGVGFSSMWADEAPSASADIDFLSSYVWRGYELSNSSIVIQPSVTLEYMGFGLNLWSNLDTSFDDGDPSTKKTGKLNETDITLSYDVAYENWSFGAGYIYYALDSAEDTKELYFSMGYDTFLSPALTIYRDIDAAKGWYLSLSAEYSIPLGDRYALDLAGALGYYSSGEELDSSLVPTGNRYNGLHDGIVSASISFPVGEYVSITPSVSYSFPLSGKAENAIRSNSLDLFNKDSSSFFFGGISLSIGF